MSKQRVASFEELEVYKRAFELQQEIFEVTRAWPKAEQYALTDQIRRASRSIGANIAEAWAKRRYAAHFTSKLTDADGEQNETRHWLKTALACEYIDTKRHTELNNKCKSIGAMLGRMIADAEQWTVGRTVRRCDGPKVRRSDSPTVQLSYCHDGQTVRLKYRPTESQRPRLSNRKTVQPSD